MSGLEHPKSTCFDCNHQAEAITLKYLTVMYAFDKPWPFNYSAWLLDLGGPTSQTFSFDGAGFFGGYASPKTITFVRSGLLSGDFGYSLAVEPGTPVLTVLGQDGTGLPLLLFIPSVAILLFMLVVTLQRRGRPPIHGVVSFGNPARKVWRRAELWPLG